MRDSRLVRRQRRTLTALAVGGLLVVGVLVAQLHIPTAGASSDDTSAQISELNSQVAALDAQIKALQATIAGKQTQIRSLTNDIAILDATIGQLRLEIQSTTKKIELTRAQIEQLKIDIRAAEEDIVRQKRILTAFIQELYLLDQLSPLQALLGNRTLSEFVDRSQRLETIQGKVQELLAAIQVQKDALDTKRGEEVAREEELTNLKASLELTRRNEENARKAKNELLSRTRGEEGRYQQILRTTQRKEREIFNTIEALEAELRRQQEILNIDLNAPAPIPGLLAWPLIGTLTQGYGYTDYAKGGAYGGAPHTGIDIATTYGSAIRSADDGEIIATGSNGNYAYGNWVAVKHSFTGGFTLVTLYGHMISRTEVAVGQHVGRGQTIGHEGSTGYSSGPHLHFGVYTSFATSQQSYGLLPYGTTVNPLGYL